MILLVKFFIHRRQLKNGYLILINICIADFICTSSLSLSSLLHTLSPELQWEWSQAAGMSITITAATSGVCAMFMSIERYMQIVLSRPLSTTQIISGIVITWVICTFVGFVPFLTETYYLVRPSEVWCFPGFTNPTIWHIPFIVLANILVWSGLIVIPLSYWSIYRFAVSNGFKWGLERGVFTAVLGPSSAGVDVNKEHANSSKIEISCEQALEDDLSRETALRSQLELTKKLSLLVFQFYVGEFDDSENSLGIV
ncbi:hypothetical protein BKA69DRAFT_1126998 [Paraphysoderma sedebokerense]|nr:hypothetical protein BKA69DRAFT_1126998 [Paraphysoderma sedebokerense]